MNPRSQYLPDEHATVTAGQELARALQQAETESAVIFLLGELGAGKTTFARGLIRALGHEGAVKSPTYTLVEPYERLERPVYHFDLYRLADPEELELAGGRDYFSGEGICLVEWPQRAEGVLPVPDLVVDLENRLPGRHISLRACTDRGHQILAECQP